jgi:hypothetical protein
MVHAIGDVEIVTVVTKVAEIDGGRRVTINYDRNDGQLLHRETVEVSPKGLLRVNDHGRALDPPLWELKLAPKANETWTGKWPVFVDRAVVFEEQRYTAVGWETIEVPAGKFRAIRVEQEATLDELTRRTTYWYSPGLGCVKWSGNSEGVLKSFAPGKE